jgi:hypothetical protein
MQALIDWLDGKKSYILLVIGFVFNLGALLGWWTLDNQVWALVDSTLVMLLGASFRAAIQKSGPPQ